MGADMLLYRLPVDLPFDKASERLKAMTADEMYDLLLVGDASGVWDMACPPREGQDDDPDFVPDEFEKAMNDVRCRALESLEKVYGIRYSRDLEHMDFDGRTWVLTGGPSWGDSPTDMCDELSILASLGLTYDEWTRKASCPQELAREVQASRKLIADLRAWYSPWLPKVDVARMIDEVGL